MTTEDRLERIAHDLIRAGFASGWGAALLYAASELERTKAPAKAVEWLRGLAREPPEVIPLNLTPQAVPEA